MYDIISTVVVVLLISAVISGLIHWQVTRAERDKDDWDE